MKKVLCSHSMNTTNFVCKDPDHDDGRRFHIAVMGGVNVWIDERIQQEHPATFIPVEVAPEADSEELKDILEPEPTLDEIVNDLVEPAPVDAEPIEVIDEPAPEPMSDPEAEAAKETADAVDAEILAEVIDQATNETDEAELNDHDMPKSEDEEKADLSNHIDFINSKKKLDKFGAELGVKLDGRKKLEDMRAALKEALNLN